MLVCNIIHPRKLVRQGVLNRCSVMPKWWCKEGNKTRIYLYLLLSWLIYLRLKRIRLLSQKVMFQLHQRFTLMALVITIFHQAMQYKLFEYLRNLDDTDGLNQQIFVRTHSSNISAVAGLNNMFIKMGQQLKQRQKFISQKLIHVWQRALL